MIENAKHDKNWRQNRDVILQELRVGMAISQVEKKLGSPVKVYEQNYPSKGYSLPSRNYYNPNLCKSNYVAVNYDRNGRVKFYGHGILIYDKC